MRSGLICAGYPLLLLLCACPPGDAHQRALSTAAHALGAIDELAASHYASAHAEALEESESREQYDAEMSPWNRLEDGLRGSRAALLSAQDALDAWRSTSDAATFRAALPGLLGSLRAVLEHLGEVGLPAPEELTQALALLEALLGGDNESN